MKPWALLCCEKLMGLDILILVNNDKPTSRFGQTIYNNTVNFAGRGGLGTALNIMILHHYCHTSTAVTLPSTFW